jgi:hypothetical protein
MTVEDLQFASKSYPLYSGKEKLMSEKELDLLEESIYGNVLTEKGEKKNGWRSLLTCVILK